MPPNVHESALTGFGSSANPYHAGRPDYPPAIQNWLRKDLALAEEATVVDLGSGTGKFLPSLLSVGAHVIAVEPIRAMRDELTKFYPSVDVREGTAQCIPVATSSANAVTCAQSFHWFAHADVLREINRILKPEGALALIWNVREERVPWVAELTGIMSTYEGNAPRYYTQEWRRVFPADGFSALEERRFAYEHTGSPEQVIVDRVMSVSFIAALPAKEQQCVKQKVRRLIDRTPDLAGKEQVSFPYETVAYSCRKIASSKAE